MFGVDGGAGGDEYEVEIVKMLALGLVSPDPFCTLSSYYPQLESVSLCMFNGMHL